MNTNDLYSALEEHRKLIVSCETELDYYSLRAGIYRARSRYLEAFAMIDDTDSEDGFQLTVRYNKDDKTVALELKPKEAVRQWTILTHG